jgi:hypothetical protein
MQGASGPEKCSMKIKETPSDDKGGVSSTIDRLGSKKKADSLRREPAFSALVEF